MCQSTALACPLPLPLFPPIGMIDGVAPLASVYLIFVPLGNGPKIMPLPVSSTQTSRGSGPSASSAETS